MPEYRRRYISGGTYFFTVTLADRRSTLLTDRVNDLRRAWRHVARQRPFKTVAYVVLPEHLHCMWRLPDGDRDFSTRWRLLKGRFTRVVDPVLDPSTGRRPGERGVWQRRFWEHHIRDEHDFNAHLAYIHNNPVKHGYVARREDWRWSSWGRFKAMATWPEDREMPDDAYFGE